MYAKYALVYICVYVCTLGENDENILVKIAN